MQEWYNQIIDKSMQDITVADVLRMIRQNEFMDTAIQRATELLKENPLIGEIYDGELIEKISGLEPSLLKSCIPDIRNTLADALKKGAEKIFHRFLCRSKAIGRGGFC